MFINIPSFIDMLIILTVIGVSIYFLLVRKNIKKTALWALRIFVLSALVFLSLEPTMMTYDRNVKPAIAVLADNSSSMKYDGRFDRVKEKIKDNLKELKEKFRPVFYTFSGGISLVDEKGLLESTAEGNVTDIADSLDETVRSGKQRLDGIILFSDGRHNREGNDVLKTLKTLEVPVYTVYPEEREALVDISVTDVRSSDYIYKNVPADVAAVINFYGLEKREVTVYLKKGEDVIASRTIRVNNRVEEAAFNFIPTKLGPAGYSVEVPPHSAEKIVSNNKYRFNMEVIREKTRVLYICGQINPEYRFLRNLLKNDPSMELVSFIILRNAENLVFVPENDLSLIPFPVHEIFSRDLFDFDILIFENFDPARFSIVQLYLDNVSRFVTEYGGGLLVIGGDNAFGKSGYRGTSLENVLPVLLDGREEPLSEGLFGLRITDLSHPLARLTEDPGETKKIWEEMPQLDGCQKLRPRKGAKVIAVHPWEKTESGNLTAIACGEYGKGRTAALGFNTTWRWALGSSDEFDSARYYASFWKNVFKWLAQSEETKLFRISVVQKKYFVDDRIELRLVLLEDSLRACKPDMTVVDPYNKKYKMDLFRRTDYGWKAEFTPEVEGKYVFNARLLRLNRIAAGDSKEIIVNMSSGREDYDLNLNTELLKDISNATSGESVKLSGFSAERIYTLMNKEAHPAAKKQLEIWNKPLIYIILVLLLLAEWTIRKTKGML